MTVANQLKLAIVIPCYNEEPVLTETVRRLSIIMDQLVEQQIVHASSFILFIDDGSIDQTWAVIQALRNTYPRVSGIRLSRNQGHQMALWAGLEEAVTQSDLILSMDADLQDDETIIQSFIEAYLKGFDIVYGVRSSRQTDSWFKRQTAQAYYRLMQAMGVELVYNHADYRLMSQRAVQALLSFKERNLFIRGLIPQLGYPSTTVTYERQVRYAGQSKYPLFKMLNFAIEGITSFTVQPLRWIMMLGFLILGVGIGYLGYAMVRHHSGQTVDGWTSIVGSIWLLCGVQIFCTGVIGEYVGKVYKESKRRPRYFIQDRMEAGDLNDAKTR